MPLLPAGWYQPRRSNRAACGALQDFILTNQAMDLDTRASPAHWVKSHHFSIQQVVRCVEGKTTRLRRIGVFNMFGRRFGALCRPCSPGMYRSGGDSNSSKCHKCPSGFYQESEEQTLCLPALLGCTKMNRDRTNALNAEGKPLTWNNQNVYSVKSADLPKLRVHCVRGLWCP